MNVMRNRLILIAGLGRGLRAGLWAYINVRVAEAFEDTDLLALFYQGIGYVIFSKNPGDILTLRMSVKIRANK